MDTMTTPPVVDLNLMPVEWVKQMDALAQSCGYTSHAAYQSHMNLRAEFLTPVDESEADARYSRDEDRIREQAQCRDAGVEW